MAKGSIQYGGIFKLPNLLPVGEREGNSDGSCEVGCVEF